MQKGITDADVWNMDETWFRVGCGIAHWVITIDAEKKLLLSDQHNREFLPHLRAAVVGGDSAHVNSEWCSYFGEMGSRKRS